MKRVLAIAVVFALVAGAAFAEWTIGGDFGYKADVVRGDYESGADPTDLQTMIGNTAANIDVKFSGEKFGGRFRIYADQSAGPYWSASPFAHAWWKPIDKLRFQLGHNPDGDYGAGQITGWGWNGSAQNFVAIDNDSDYSNYASGVRRYGTNWQVARGTGFYGGFNASGASLSFSPIGLVDINVGIPFGDGHADATHVAYKTYRQLHVNVVLKIDGVGNAYVSWKGTSDELAYQSAGTLYASFYLNALDSLKVDLGFGYALPFLKADDTVVSPPLEAGLGAVFSKGAAGLKFRFGLKIDPKDVAIGTDDVSKLGFQLLPYFNFEKLSVYFNFGMGLNLPAPETALVDLDWYVNPYVKVPAGGLTFWAGFKLGGYYNANSSNSGITWSVPIGIGVGF